MSEPTASRVYCAEIYKRFYARLPPLSHKVHMKIDWAMDGTRHRTLRIKDAILDRLHQTAGSRNPEWKGR